MAEMQQQPKSFRAIIVGAGVTGLTAAHTFDKAGIDYVLVEKWAEAAPPAGASLGLYPSSLRVFQQLGVLEQVKKLGDPFTDGATNRGPNGKPIVNSDLWGYFRENHGDDVLMLERRAFLEVMYETLPDKSKIQFSKKITSFTESEEGIEVNFADGTCERGDIVVGADGVHSVVRQAMWDCANRLEPGLITVEEKKTIMTTWTCLFGFGPGEPSLRNELSVSSFDDRRCILFATQPKQSFFFVFWKPKQPWSRYTRPKYSADDVEKAAASVADLPVNETMVFAELWKKKFRAQLADIEEGVLSHWHYGRYVLVGDAAHKVTPNMALGGNLGIESVIVLTNLLRKEFRKREGEGRNMGNTEIQTVFEQFQIQQLGRARAVFDLSAFVSRAQAWDTPWLKFSSMYIAPRTDPRTMPNAVGEILRRAPILDFLPLGTWPEGKMKWENGDEDAKRAAAAVKTKSGMEASCYPVSASHNPALKLFLGGLATASVVMWYLHAING